jgi:protein gp37
MADNSKIEWTDATWNPITGCSIVSPGCRDCYAMQLAGTRLHKHPSRAGLTKVVNGNIVWTGEVRFNEGWLDQPLHWRRSRMIFVCAHGDLFHEGVRWEWLDQIFDVMERADWHYAFQVLTKRSAEMLAYIKHRYSGRTPPPHIWLGISAERQQEWDERTPHLRETPAAVRFVSLEPLIGPIEMDWLPDWIIVGGESGNDPRAMHPAWARSIRDQCAAAGKVDRFFFKQWGEWAPSTPEHAEGNPRAGWQSIRAHPAVAKFADLLPENGAEFIERVGKKRAGRLLDGVEHNGMPRPVFNQ